MKILVKVGTSIFVFFVGAILSGLAKETGSSGNYLILGVTAVILFYIWKK